MCLKLAYHGCGCISSGGIRLGCECCCGGFSGGDGGVDVDAATRTCPSNANRLPAGQTWARSFLQARALSISCIHRTRVHMVCAQHMRQTTYDLSALNCRHPHRAPLATGSTAITYRVTIASTRCRITPHTRRRNRSQRPLPPGGDPSVRSRRSHSMLESSADSQRRWIQSLLPPCR
jgi:hypothetical protein